MNALVSAVCEQLGWADGEALRARITRAVPEVASELGLAPEPSKWGLESRVVRAVVERCTVNETYFFRHAEQLQAACAELQRAFPEGALSVWSAACSTGEEAYSLSMQLLDAGVSPARLSVLGTDVSEAALAQAGKARYPEWSFRGVPARVRERCFVQAPREGAALSFEVIGGYRAPVRFLAHNLLSPPPVRQAHLIACRNVLIYLQPAAAYRALRHLESVLVPGGFLLLGTAEQHLAAALGLEQVLVGAVVLLRKRTLEAPPRPVAPVARALPQPAPTPPCAAPRQPEPPSSESAWRWLRAGLCAEARAQAEAAAAAQDAEAHLVLATLDEARGEPQLALEHLRRALYLDPRLIVAHAAQASLYQRLGRDKDASRARANALRHLRALDPDTILRAAAPVTARELKEALEAA